MKAPGYTGLGASLRGQLLKASQGNTGCGVSFPSCATSLRAIVSDGKGTGFEMGEFSTSHPAVDPLNAIQAIGASPARTGQEIRAFRIDRNGSKQNRTTAGLVKLTTACRGLGRVAPGCARAGKEAGDQRPRWFETLHS